MTNWEYLVKNCPEKLKELLLANVAFASTSSGEICLCRDTLCKECEMRIFSDNCHRSREMWLEQEYEEKRFFTSEEKEFVRHCDKLKYFARDKGGALWGFSTLPVYDNGPGKWFASLSAGVTEELSDITTLKFEAIKETDKESTSREEILGEEK